MYRVLVFSSTVMRLASLVEFAVGECERAYEFHNPSSAGNKKTAKEGDGIWPGSKTKSDCFAWAQVN
ncbi:hypothetical protein Pmar_PMAR027193 [Perkinsus marinus ATCC 50983]|uniref:Secreted protein n=1 Tax=Perkinsus marinus (strain ATCC 50983 / TXsc) TaxID=423536 RepID=C5L802_PERM5|nr:hypothetical protein Pmar_PMAR027193 [Perkinsus marinus ATCC 50983]EER07148.1 hypothetical protein Pmar_PMAR027193 [Perkinsus marinus ATCC 50983]|eukprot:XP_002775332.1 hypothetical protein Pmar_PMAR027193 [Perkinsus marinus ATCC 50983]